MLDLSEVHEQLLDILIEFDRICRKHDLKYTLAWGTMLGAVRHGGFIPWDDDIDILMRRADYEKFCTVCKNDLNSKYFLQTKDTEQSYRYNVARLRKNDTTLILRTWKNAGFHQGIYIDIQPVDKLANNRIERAVQKFLIVINTPVRISMNPVLFKANGERYNGFTKKLLFYLARIMPKKLCDKIEYKSITGYNSKPCEKIGVICEGGVLLHTTRDMIPFKATFMDEYTDLAFEGHCFMSVKATDELLKLWYGDYMKLPPLEDRHPEHDPLVFDVNNSFQKYVSGEIPYEQNSSYLYK